MTTVNVHGRTTNPKHGSELEKFKKFEDWGAVLAHVKARKTTFYFPPMNYLPSEISCRIHKSGNVWVDVNPSQGDSFVADVGHFDRFFYKEESRNDSPIKARCET